MWSNGTGTKPTVTKSVGDMVFDSVVGRAEYLSMVTPVTGGFQYQVHPDGTTSIVVNPYMFDYGNDEDSHNRRLSYLFGTWQTGDLGVVTAIGQLLGYDAAPYELTGCWETKASS